MNELLIKTRFYGEIEVSEDEILYFPKGLPGFEDEHRFLYLQPDKSVFGCLQSCDSPELAFVVISPFTVCPDYSFDLDNEITEQLGVRKPEEVLLLSIVTIPPGKADKATVNLQAPLVINVTGRQGQQAILADLGYPVRCRLFKDDDSQTAVAGE